jgi:ribose 5-phosphate isomerase B
MIDYDTHSLITTKIHIAADHAGFEMKGEIMKYLEKGGYEVVDYGAYEYDEEDDYPEFCAIAARAVSIDHKAKGIILGGSGQGEAIVANRFPNVRAVVYNGQTVRLDGVEVPEEIITARQHNDANILSIGARFISNEEALEAVEQFLDTDFGGEERHIRRLQKIEQVFNIIHQELENE